MQKPLAKFGWKKIWALFVGGAGIRILCNDFLGMQKIYNGRVYCLMGRGPKVDHIGVDTAYHCERCGHHHCIKCGICHRCGCLKYVKNKKEARNKKQESK